MFQATTSARFLSAPIAFAILAAAAFPQAPFVKTTYGVAPVDPPLWARLSEALSDADIAKINLAAFAKGNKVAAWELGIAYMQGLGISQNFEKAEQMFRIGAVDADKKGMVGMFYAHGYFPKISVPSNAGMPRLADLRTTSSLLRLSRQREMLTSQLHRFTTPKQQPCISLCSKTLGIRKSGGRNSNSEILSLTGSTVLAMTRKGALRICSGRA
jgi:hypothetical protein